MIKIFSPHVDDAVLSLGGFIRNHTDRGAQILVYNFFTITNWMNPSLCEDTESDIQTVTMARKEEERSVESFLKFDSFFLDFNDYCLRNGDSKVDELRIRTSIDLKVRELVDERTPCFFPIGDGHPDHAILSSIGFQLLTEGFDILFFEDQPYAACGEYDYQAMSALFRSRGLEPVYEQFSISDKVKALRLYASQVSDEWVKDIQNYSYDLKTNNFYERFWTKEKNVNKLV